MRIAQVSPVYPPYRGGIGNVAHEYATRLQALGHTVEVFTPALKIGNAGFLRHIPKKESFDVVHLHYPFYGGAEQIALACGVPIVLTYHMDAMAPGIKGKFFEAHRRLIQPLILFRAKKILVSSFDYANHSALVSHAKEKWIEMPFGVDLARFCPVVLEEENTLRVSLNIPLDAPVILFVGGLDSAHIFKGMPILLQALRLISFPYHLVVVGDGNLRASFEATAKTLVYRDNIHFVGSVSKEALPAYYRLADIHVLPATSQAEAFGIVSLEAGASGIPTIASDLPGVRSVVKDQETGLLVLPNDHEMLAKSLDLLLKNKELRENMGSTARKRIIDKYAWDGLIERLVEVYKDVV